MYWLVNGTEPDEMEGKATDATDANEDLMQKLIAGNYIANMSTWNHFSLSLFCSHTRIKLCVYTVQCNDSFTSGEQHYTWLTQPHARLIWQAKIDLFSLYLFLCVRVIRSTVFDAQNTF